MDLPLSATIMMVCVYASERESLSLFYAVFLSYFCCEYSVVSMIVFDFYLMCLLECFERLLGLDYFYSRLTSHHVSVVKVREVVHEHYAVLVALSC